MRVRCNMLERHSFTEGKNQNLPSRETMPTGSNSHPAISRFASKRGTLQVKDTDMKFVCRHLSARLRNKLMNFLFRAVPSASPILVMFQPT